ncbi:BPSL0067 family protein [Methylobacterium dankookense]|uniref:BPSL0067 family protein n=1 Tax=Methylobacterium dankookense TaxID=560405 RepID=UPI001AEDCC44|nr:BPSL0067 family protein [Methylobacterium dankookense]
MPHKMNVAEEKVKGISKYVHPTKKTTECVSFVQQVTDVGATTTWTRGKQIWGAKEQFEKYIAIATFDGVPPHYPTDDKGKHAAIYLSHDENGIEVLDQWASQKQVLRRKINFKCAEGTKRSNDGKTFYVIE